MTRRLLLTALLVLGAVLVSVPAYAAVPSVPHTVGTAIALSSWPSILAGFCGFGSAQITAFLTHKHAPQWIKSGINLALSSLAGILITVTVVPGATWKQYVAEIGTAWIIALGTHFAGLTALVGNSTWNVGVGAGVAPLVSPAPGITSTSGDDAQGRGVY